MYLQGRPPVTNLYSSALFVGWGSVLLCLFLERFYKNGIGSVCASTIGFVTLLIAHNLQLDGDSLEMLRAVLDTNVWLATHVVMVTLGYSSVALAGFLGIIYILRGLFTTSFNETTASSLGRMIWRHLLCDLVQLRRNHPWRNLGRSILGAILGMGPKGERSASYRPVERYHSSRPLGWLHSRTWNCCDECFWQHRGQSVLVRSEHAGRRSALLRLYGSGVRYSDDVHRHPTGRHGSGDAPPEILARHPGAGETSFRGPGSAVTCA